MVDIDFTTNADKVKKDVEELRQTLRKADKDLDKVDKANKKVSRSNKQVQRSTDASKRSIQRKNVTTKKAIQSEVLLDRSIKKSSAATALQNTALKKNVASNLAAANAANVRAAAEQRAAIASKISAGGAAVGGAGGGRLGQAGGAIGAFGAKGGIAVAAIAAFALKLTQLNQQLDRSIEVFKARQTFEKEAEQQRLNLSSGAAATARSTLQVRRNLRFQGFGNLVEREADTSNFSSLSRLTGGNVEGSLRAIEKLVNLNLSPSEIDRAYNTLTRIIESGGDLQTGLAFLTKNKSAISSKTISELTALEFSQRTRGRFSPEQAAQRLNNVGESNTLFRQLNKQAFEQSDVPVTNLSNALIGREGGSLALRKEFAELTGATSQFAESLREQLAIENERIQKMGALLTTLDVFQYSLGFDSARTRRGNLRQQQDQR